MDCPQCGSEVQADWHQCHSCGFGGSEVSGETSATTTAAPQPTTGQAWQRPIADPTVAPAAPPMGALAPGAPTAQAPVYPLFTSVSLGLAAGLVLGFVWFLFTYETKWVIGYAGLVIGLGVGAAVDAKADPATRVARGLASVAITIVTLFFSQYFVMRQLELEALVKKGRITTTGSAPLFLPISDMFSVVGDFFSSAPFAFVAWGFAIYGAWSLPAGKKARARASS